MGIDQIVVTAGGALFIALVVWFFWGPKGEGVAAGVTSSGYQEAMVLVKGGYTPDIIVVKAGKPVRLHFTRQESSACSEMVLFPELGKSAKLPEGQEVVLEVTPEKPGEYGFQCQMGMLRGKLIVEG